jgi:SAM-dependent methyltransferase
MAAPVTLDAFLGLLAGLGRIDVALVREVALHNLAFLSASKKVRAEHVEGQRLQARWYAALDSGTPDYSVYATDYYLGELWACWQVYPRKYLKAIQSPTSLTTHSIVQDIGPVRSVVDLGCGCGHATAGLKTLFPDADVFGTNLPDTPQWTVAQSMARDGGFILVDSLHALPVPLGLVFASEFFEHLPAPVAYLREVLALCPSHLLIANSFGADAIGHFRTYTVDGYACDGRTTSRLFNAELRRQGYRKVETKLWNNRPAYWVRTADARHRSRRLV